MSGLRFAILLALLAVAVRTTSASAPWRAFFCPASCPHCFYGFDYQTCFSKDGQYQNENFTAFSLEAIASDTAEGFNFTVLFYNNASCSGLEQVVARTPSCALGACCATGQITLGSNWEFHAFRVANMNSWTSPSPTPKPCDSDDDKPPLWTVIVMAALGGSSAVLLVVVVGLVCCLVKRGQYQTLN
ncbi:uncharacterized protein ACA1_329630 [Acanthamoeba castellanii str. Neff]|uniref:Uncharacterized protein n=1 Tax=Acanthamoeba castellanii (strain ATCC 30010 / Neff) TaxID=1257118 RepID=L8GHW0_ACACF|nr:uncharacterized protein ACA1_329630 [Acanthamoeba castellanii str. Neff]ELR12557.1 hypothetical protein ACA1_329630 [Acanthamoeba castellanii str. Neff]